MSGKSTKKAAARRSFKATDWKQFVSRLSLAMTKTTCANDFRQSKRVLSDMGVRPDVLSYCEDNGGHCDCEIILNVEPPTKFDFPEEEAPRRRRQKRGETT